MENTAEYDALKSINEEERIQLQNKLCAQRIELEERKKYLEELKRSNESILMSNEVKESNITRDSSITRNISGDEYPDPDQMLKNFLESLEKEDQENVLFKKQLNGSNDRIYLDNHIINGSLTKDQFYNNSSSLEEHTDHSFLFKKNNSSGKNFNFKINKVKYEKVINVKQKNIINFDKSTQVNMFDSGSATAPTTATITAAATTTSYHQRNGKGKMTTLFSNTGAQKDSTNKMGKLHSNMTMSSKKNVVLKKKKLSEKEDFSSEEGGEEQSEERNEYRSEEVDENRVANRVSNREADGEEDLEQDADNIKSDKSSTHQRLSNQGKPKNCLKEGKNNIFVDEEKRKSILKSSSYMKFIQNSSKIIERSLGEQDMFNSTFDFVAKDISDESESFEKLKFLNTYYCKKYTNGRPITDVKTSHIYSDLFLASYGLSDVCNYADPDGYILVWNITMNSRPEYVFTSQHAVCTTLFNKFNPHLIIGGTYTGNVVLWDIRANQKPIQKTYLTSQGHLHPIYCAEVIGTQNAHNLVTVDTDGRLCNWSLNMLTYPSDTVDLKRANKEVSCCSFSFQEGEINTLYGGAEDGSLFQAQIHGNKVGITEYYNIHHGPLTATQFHPLIEGTNDHNDLILTSSVDWTCKLISIKQPRNILFTFNTFEDYLMDVKWSPTHPSIFAACSSNGNITLFNISYDMECSFFETTVQEKSTNKIAWSYDGRKLIAADSDGGLTLWNASTEIYQPRAEDVTQFDSKIEKLKAECVPADQVDMEMV
ncbi:uncharacterized protein MKS88_000015 [Plasmodium brasilianum]|nr:cytoplasmic dynein intermediate chain, putative [Plasmodium malariae]KAI4841478.1 hypothetical protein MKS88_000015 [Plasmodium brasilianum]SBT86632.1 cytoplasmic dynein intermediate chain, putative [Plasmodium malariae]